MNLKLYLSRQPSMRVGVILINNTGMTYFLKIRKKGRKYTLIRELLRSPENKKWDMYIYFVRRGEKRVYTYYLKMKGQEIAIAERKGRNVRYKKTRRF